MSKYTTGNLSHVPVSLLKTMRVPPFGEITTHLSVTHKGGKTAMIYRDDGRIFRGPRTDYNAWDLQDEEILMGSNKGCADTALFG